MTNICVLLNQLEFCDKRVNDFIDNLQSLMPEASFYPLKLDKLNAAATIHRTIGNRDFDVYLNLCDGSPFCQTPGIEVIQILEKRNVAFTGASSLFYDPSRLAMKMVAHSVGVNFPKFFMVENIRFNISDILETLSFPMFVKHPNGANSNGLTPASLVRDVESLKTQIQLIVSEFGSALIEEFIAGKEFTVLVQENPNSNQGIVYTPLECVLNGDSDFKHYQKKWIDFHEMGWRKCEDEVLLAKLKQVSLDIFHGFEGNGYARFDYRVDVNNNIYMLEINPNCGIFGWSEDTFCSADFILMHDDARKSFFQNMIELAQKRKRDSTSKIKVKFSDCDGFYLSATELIKKGDNIYTGTKTGEYQNYRLISKSIVEKTWSEKQKKLFKQYAWPLNEEVFVVWSDNCENWLPIQHSCEPNSAMNFLNLIALNDIQLNEAITVDYSTFCNDEMLEFICTCNTINCRKIIKGFQHEDAKFIKKVYGDANVSSYIRTKLV